MSLVGMVGGMIMDVGRKRWQRLWQYYNIGGSFVRKWRDGGKQQTPGLRLRGRNFSSNTAGELGSITRDTCCFIHA
eukprot:scaffold43956_cov237-Amphora_coffeaeformis.AAC.3